MATSAPSAAAAAMMSPHRDVLEASPENADSKAKLVEELQARGRAAVGAKSWMDGKLLYEKALTVVEDSDSNKKAVLSSNLSLVELKMGRGEAAKDAAEVATKADPTYVKAWWRLGQALTALKQPNKALEALQKAHFLDPTNKALVKEMARVQEAVDEEMERSMAETDGEEDADGDAKMKPAQPSPAPASVKPISKEPSNKTTTNSLGSSEMRGYKIVNGKKTTFFHNELSEEARKLIGEIAPKKLESVPPPAPAASAAAKGTSAWNNAGTWEEKNVSSWAKETLTNQLLQTTFMLPTSSPAPNALVTVSKVKQCDGHASVAVARGKTRFIYEWCVKLEWHLGGAADSGDDLDCSGSLAIPDIDGTIAVGEGYEIHEFAVDNVSNNSVKPLVDRFVHRGGFHEALNESIDDWVRLFKKEYGPKE